MECNDDDDDDGVSLLIDAPQKCRSDTKLDDVDAEAFDAEAFEVFSFTAAHAYTRFGLSNKG